MVIADDQAMVVEGFAALLDAQPDIEVVGKAENGREAVDATRRHRRLRADWPATVSCPTAAVVIAVSPVSRPPDVAVRGGR